MKVLPPGIVDWNKADEMLCSLLEKYERTTREVRLAKEISWARRRARDFEFTPTPEGFRSLAHLAGIPRAAQDLERRWNAPFTPDEVRDILKTVLSKLIATLETSQELLDFTKLKGRVSPGEEARTSTFYFCMDGFFQEVKSIRHFLAQVVKAFAFEVTEILGIPREVASNILYRTFSLKTVQEAAKTLHLLLPEAQTPNWDDFLVRGEHLVFLRDSTMLVVKENGINRVQHDLFNRFAIPAEITFEKPEKWLALLVETLDESTEAFLDFLALSLSPVSKDKAVGFLIGKQDTGKSTILDSLAIVLGRETVKVIDTRELRDKSFHLERFTDSLLVIAHEARREKLDEAVIKTLAARDVVLIDRKFKAALEGRPTARLLVATNSMPILSDHSEATIHRIWLFETRKPSQVRKRNEILQIVEREAPVIRGYLIQRLHNIVREGLSPATQEYLHKKRAELLQESNPVAAFWTVAAQNSETFIKRDLEILRLAKEGARIPYREIADAEERVKRFSPYQGRDGWLKFDRNTAYQLYRIFCAARGYQPLSESGFWEASPKLDRYAPVEVRPRRSIKIEGKVVQGYFFRLKPSVEKVEEPVYLETPWETSEVEEVEKVEGVPDKLTPDSLSPRRDNFPSNPSTSSTFSTSVDTQAFHGGRENLLLLPQEEKNVAAERKKEGEKKCYFCRHFDRKEELCRVGEPFPKAPSSSACWAFELRKRPSELPGEAPPEPSELTEEVGYAH